jgi:hypothetical protein
MFKQGPEKQGFPLRSLFGSRLWCRAPLFRDRLFRRRLVFATMSSIPTIAELDAKMAEMTAMMAALAAARQQAVEASSSASAADPCARSYCHGDAAGAEEGETAKTASFYRGPGGTPMVLPKHASYQPSSPAAQKEAKKAVADATGGGRWKRKGGGESGSESSSAPASSSGPTVKQCVDVAIFVLAAEQAADDEMDQEPPDWESDSEPGARSVPWMAGSSRSTATGFDEESIAGPDVAGATLAAKRAAKKQRQKERDAAEKQMKKAKQLEDALMSIPAEPVLTKSGKVRPQPKRLSHDAPNFKELACKDCAAVGHWRYMPATWVCEYREQFKGDGETRWSVSHRCVPCEAKAVDKTEQEVRDECLGAPMDNKKFRADQYKTKLAEKRMEFAATDASNRMIKMLTRGEMHTLFAPLGGYLLRKKEALDLVCKDVEEHARLVNLLQKATSMEQERLIMDRMEALEVDDKYLAFADKGVDQHAWIQVCSFSDSWTTICDGAGNVVGGICSYYPCLGNTRWGAITYDPCCRVLPSKEWLRGNEDPAAPRQRYYCFCAKKHEPKWGQLVEIKRMNATGGMDMWYMRAEVPPADAEDVRAMYLEDHEGKGCRTTKELYDKLKVVRPTVSSLVVPDPTLPGQLMMTSKAEYMALPEFSWWEIFSFAGVSAPKWAKPPKQ